DAAGDEGSARDLHSLPSSVRIAIADAGLDRYACERLLRERETLGTSSVYALRPVAVGMKAVQGAHNGGVDGRPLASERQHPDWGCRRSNLADECQRVAIGRRSPMAPPWLDAPTNQSEPPARSCTGNIRLVLT